MTRKQELSALHQWQEQRNLNEERTRYQTASATSHGQVHTHPSGQQHLPQWNLLQQWILLARGKCNFTHRVLTIFNLQEEDMSSSIQAKGKYPPLGDRGWVNADNFKKKTQFRQKVNILHLETWEGNM